MKWTNFMNCPGISILKFNEIVPRKETANKGRINFIIWGSKKYLNVRSFKEYFYLFLRVA